MKFPSVKHLPFSKGIGRSDKIAHDISNLIGQEIIISEKIDGSNVCVEGNGYFHGRSDKKPELEDWNKNLYHDERLLELMINEGNNCFFFENTYAVHSIEYPKLTDTLHLIAVTSFDRSDNWFAGDYYSDVISQKYNIPRAPKLFCGVVNSVEHLELIINGLMTIESFYGGQKEGLVVRNSCAFPYSEFNKNVFKYVRENHVQTDDNWKKTWKKANIYIE